MKTSIIKTIAFGLAMTFSMSVNGQLVVSQFITNKQPANNDMWAVEIYNTSETQATFNNQSLTLSVNGTTVWQNSGTFSLKPKSVFVVLRDLTSQGVGNDPQDMIASKGCEVFTSLNLVIEKNDVILLSGTSTDATITQDQIGSTGENYGDNNINYSRSLPFLTVGQASGTWTQGNGQSQAPVNTFVDVYSPESNFTYQTDPGTTFDYDDFEGLGLPPSNIRWNGSAWVSPSNPTNGSANPTAGNNCHIGSTTGTTVTLPVSLDVAGVEAEDGSTVTLEAGTGNLGSGYAQAKYLRRKGGADPDGVFKVEKRLENAGWHLIGSPFTNGFENVEGKNAGGLYWFWNGSGWSDGATNPPPGQGLMVYVGSGPTYSYASNQTTIRTSNGGTTDSYGQFEWNTTPGAGDGNLYYLQDGHTSVTQGTGWNLLSNPFPCGLDWNTLWDGGFAQNVDATIEIWDPVVNDYISYNAADGVGSITDGIIPPNAAFWVKLNSSTASISADVELHGVLTEPASGYNKNLSYDRDVLQVSITDMATSSSSLFLITDVSNATSNYDIGLDTWKRTTKGDGIPDIFFTDGASGEICQNLTNLSLSQSMVLETSDLIPGKQYSINVDQYVLNNEYHVSLEDTQLKTISTITNSPYVFQQPSEYIDERFILHINQNTMGITPSSDMEVLAFVQDNILKINPGQLNLSKVRVISMEGKLIAEKSNIVNMVDICTLSSHGIYLVEIEDNNGSSHQKVIY